ncbi:MAG TPA: hypothetical protein DCM87_08500 [Planctomycetes bacterium]|nr:hypothetical protein [Planctomycetota bacterium]
MVAIVFGSAVPEAQARDRAEAALAQTGAGEVLLRIAPSGRIVLLRREDGGRIAEERFARGEDARALAALRSDRVVVVCAGSPRVPDDGRDAQCAAVAAPASLPGGVKGAAARAVRALGRLFFGIDAALLAASWCALPRHVLVAASDAGLGPALLPAAVARAAPRAGLRLRGVPPAADAPPAGAAALALALWRGLGFAMAPAGARPAGRALLALALVLALGGLVQKTGETSRRAVLAFAPDSVHAPRWGIPAAELRRHLPPEGRVFAIVEPRPAHFRTYWYLQNCLCPRIVVCDAARFEADRAIEYAVMKFDDPGREAEFCAAHGVRVAARCAKGFAVGRRGP